jgi:ankyrin repeat protein
MADTSPQNHNAISAKKIEVAVNEAVVRYYHNLVFPAFMNEEPENELSNETIERLHDICVAGDLDALMEYHAQGGNLSAEDNLILISSIIEGHLHIVEFLHEAGVDFTDDSLAPLMKATQFGHLPIVKYLHQHVEGYNNPEVLESALEATEYVEVAEYLSEHITDPSLYTKGLWNAVTTDNVDLVQFFHERGADITAAGNFALFTAAYAGHIETIEYLCEHGAKLDLYYDDALQRAALSGRLDIIKLLHNPDSPYNDAILVNAAYIGRLDIVQYLHEQGADITAHGLAALHYAAQNGDLKLVKYLHENGVDIHRISQGTTPLISAAYYGQLDVIKYLHEQGADIHHMNEDHHTAIICASAYGRLDTVKYLHEHGADISANDDMALIQAALNGRVDILTYLHEQGGDLSAWEDRPLISAAQEGRNEVITYLLQNGVDLTDRGEQALEWALKHGHIKTAELLLDAENTLLQSDRPTIKNYLKWKQRHGECPDGINSPNPYAFRPLALFPIQRILHEEKIDEKAANAYAYNASALFKTMDRFWRYAEKWGDFAEKQVVHDLIQHIKIPTEGRPDLNAWADACMKFGPKMTRLVKFADKCPTPLKDDRGGWSYQLTRKEISKHAYSNAHEAPELAEMCFDVDYTEAEFTAAITTLDTYTYTISETTCAKERFPNSQIPDIRIDGERFDKPGYVLRKLESGDPKGLLLGEFTDCCQHIAGQGRECTEHGFLSPNGGFYVVEKEKTGEITGQSWVWRGKQGELVLDSFESLNGHFDVKAITKICEEIAYALTTHTTKLAKPVNGLYLGQGGATPATLAFNKAASPAKPCDYDKYRDSHEQYKIPIPEKMNPRGVDLTVVERFNEP